MQIVNGASSWKMKIRRQNDGIVILRAVTCEENAVLPDILLGVPVFALGDHALAAGAGNVDGEEIEVRGGPETGEWNNRRIRELTLPEPLLRIENYAMYNCSSMTTLRFHDRIEELGSDIFMNCRMLSSVCVQRTSQKQGPMLAYLARCFPRELEVAVTEEDGEHCEYILPEYWEHIEENSPAHQFEFKLSGAGYPYHNDVFVRGQMDLVRYDAEWKHYLELEHEDSTALAMAWKRLRTPKDLSERAELIYETYLREHIREALLLAVRTDDTAGLRRLLGYPEACGEELAEASALARQLRRTGAMALLLERRTPDRNRGLDKKYDL